MGKQNACRSDSKLVDGEKSGNKTYLWYLVFLVAALFVNLSRHVVNHRNTAYMVDYQLVYVGCNAFVNGANPMTVEPWKPTVNH